MNSEPLDAMGILESYQQEIEDNDDNPICLICHDILDNGLDQVYELPECNHLYHTNCIVTWFRSGHSNCPYCGNRGLNEKKEKRRYYRRYEKSEINAKLKLANYATTPKNFKDMVKKYNKTVENFEEFKKEIKNNSSKPLGELTLTEANKIHNQNRSKKWRLLRKINILAADIAEFPVIPLIIPVKKTIQ